jgi:hypothetical protein
MLKEKDLMIGDIVMYNPNVFEDDEYMPPKPLKIRIICDNDDIGLACEDCYTEVSLTAKILEKLGFKSIYDDCSCYRMKGPFLKDDDRLEYDITIDLEHPNCSYISHNISIKRRSSMTYHGPIISLHQLQHLLRDCDLGEIADGFYDKLKIDKIAINNKKD